MLGVLFKKSLEMEGHHHPCLFFFIVFVCIGSQEELLRSCPKHLKSEGVERDLEVEDSGT